MFFKVNTDQKIAQIETEMEAWDLETKELFDELGISPEQLDAYMGNAENFVPEDWDEMQKQLKAGEDETCRQVDSVKDPESVKKAYASQAQVQPGWFFVR